METVRAYVEANIITIATVLAILVGIVAFCCWAGSGRSRNPDYPVTQRVIDATNFKGVKLTPKAKSNVTQNIWISFNKDGSGGILSGKDLEKSGLYIREIRHELRDESLYSPEFWQEMVERGDIYDTIFVIDSTK
jgi:hypothetical protein